jgi:hypothetical protein
MRLLSKTPIPLLGDEKHCHPITSGVTRNLFRATALYNFHNFVSPVAPLEGTPEAVCRMRQKKSVQLDKKI